VVSTGSTTERRGVDSTGSTTESGVARHDSHRRARRPVSKNEG
jgi:hypothetical protein